VNTTTHPKQPLLLAAVGVVLALVATLFAATPASAAGTSTMSGIVRGNEVPLSNALVVAYAYDVEGEHVSTTTTRTDSLGGFSFVNLEAGYYEVTASDESGPFASTAWNNVNPYYWGDLIALDPDESVDGIDFTLPLAGVLQGSATAPGLTSTWYQDAFAELLIFDGETSSWVSPGEYAAVSASGEFEFADLFPDIYRVRVAYAGAQGRTTVTSSSLTVEAGATTSALLTLSSTTPWVLPSIIGDPRVGSPSSLNLGSWSQATDLTYAWLTCEGQVSAQFEPGTLGCYGGGSGGTNWNPTFVPGPAGEGNWILASVSGFFEGYGRITATTATRKVEPAAVNPSPPVFHVSPSIVHGDAAIGSNWVFDVGGFGGYPYPTATYGWVRCNQPIAAAFATLPAGCTVIAGANETSYLSTAADAGKYLSGMVTLTNAYGTVRRGAPTTVATEGPFPPANTVAPTVMGNTAVGSTWSVNKGTWTGTPAPTIVQAWLRCNQPVTTNVVAVPAGCVATGARGTTYVSTSSDAGKYITAQVAGVNSAGTTNIVALTTVATAGPVVPAATVKPTVTGNASVGSTWTLNTGTWSGSPTTIVQAWLRCNAPVTTNVAAVPAGCVATGARGTTYVSTSYDAGKYITAQVAGINSAGTTNVVALTTVATTGPTIPAATVKPTVSGSAAVGSTWTLNTGTWSGSPTKIVHAWLRCNAPVTSYVVAVPAGCVATGAKGTTYVSTSYDAGKHITAQVAAINAAGTTNVVALTTVATTGPTVPAATVKPTVSGSAAVGSTWTLNTGTWSGSPTKIVQAWLLCNAPVATNVVAVPAGCVATGARGTTYISTSYDAGKYITAQVAAINAAGTTNVVALTTVATTGPMAPAATVAPTVTGNAAIGSTWTLTTGTWSGSPTKIIQAWLRCTSPVTTNVVAVPAGCVATGAKGTTYISTSSDAGKYITAQVAAYNAVGVTNIVALTTVTTE
jgi:hypothetical protein